jgi:hypothetical protein
MFYEWVAYVKQLFTLQVYAKECCLHVKKAT